MSAIATALLAAALAAPAGAVSAGASETDADYVPTTRAPAGMGEALGLVPPGLGAHLPGVSLFGAEALPRGQVGLYGAAGFPYLTAEALWGAWRRVGLYARFDSLWSLMEQATVGVKWTVIQTARGDALALRFEANQSVFADSAAQDRAPSTSPDEKAFSARWLTGQGNEGLAAALVLSTRYSSGMTLFFDGTLDLTVDTEPLAGGPLQGNPPPFDLGLNAPLHVGLEVPMSSRMSFVVTIGADLHFDRVLRQQDSIAIPFFALGIDGLL